MIAAAAGVSVATSVLLWRPPGRWVLAVRLGTVRRTGLPLRRLGRPLLVGVSSAVVVVVATAAGPATVVVATTVAGAGLFVARTVAAGRARSAAALQRAQVCTALDLLAADLRAGLLPRHALAALADELALLRPAAVAARHDGDVTAALRSAGSGPGASALADLAAAWEVADRTGAPLADVLDRVAAAVRDDTELDREVRAEAAPARATGRLMAVLPVLGLSLGAGLGGDPVHVLTATLPGAGCLAAGVGLACLGVAWVDRIAAPAETGR